MEIKEIILKEKFEGSHPSHWLELMRTEWKIEAIYSAMESYAQYKVNELNNGSQLAEMREYEEQNIIEPQQPAFLQAAVMRSASEILERMNEAERDCKAHAEWIVKARTRYDDSRRWGEADYGEVQTAQDAYNDSFKELRVLQWVVGRP